MDIKMPVMNGLEATKIIKDRKTDVAIIAQSAYTSGTDKQAALKAGCNDFISKPVNMSVLFELIKKYKKS
jgi:CheY-like chemotaxis protein